MTKFTRKAAAAVVIAALALSAAGCSQANKPAESTTTTAAAQSDVTTTTAAPETTTAASETTTQKTTTTPEATEAPETEVSENDNGQEGAADSTHPFKPGVWLATDGNYEGMYYDETYMLFKADGTGSTRSQSMGIGVPFSYAMDAEDPLKGVFTMAAVDNNIGMEIIESDTDRVKVKWENVDAVEEWIYLCPQDEFSCYSSESLGEMAKYYYGIYEDATTEISADVSLEECFNGKVKILIFDPNEPDGTKSMLKWYFIDRYTGKGTDKEGNEVDLTQFEGEWDEMPYPERFSAFPDIKQRHELLDNGEMLGVWYLGYIDTWMSDIDYYRDMFNFIFEQTGMMKDFRFLKHLSYQNFVQSENGQELYFILPSEENGSITVSAQELDENGTLKELGYIYDNGGNYSFPLLIKCNQSEIYSDVLIRYTDTQGNTIEWSPMISGKDGTVETGDSGKIHDYTDYENLMKPDMFPAVG